MLIASIQKKCFNIKIMKETYRERRKELEEITLPIEEHQTLFHHVYLYNYKTTSKVRPQKDIFIA